MPNSRTHRGAQGICSQAASTRAAMKCCRSSVCAERMRCPQQSAYRRLLGYGLFLYSYIIHRSDLNTSDSLAQNIDRLFFADVAHLKGEFDELYNALFSNADTYISIVKLLSENKSGLTREDIAKATWLEGSFLSKILKNLERCDFVTRLSHFGSKT